MNANGCECRENAMDRVFAKGFENDENGETLENPFA